MSGCAETTPSLDQSHWAGRDHKSLYSQARDGHRQSLPAVTLPRTPLTIAHSFTYTHTHRHTCAVHLHTYRMLRLTRIEHRPLGLKRKKKVVYGPNADVKGIVVLIYGGPVAGLWCIAEGRHFTLWWILVGAGPDKFWRHFRGCCMPGA